MGFGSNPDMKFGGGGGFGGGRRKSSGSGRSGGIDIMAIIDGPELKKLYTKLQMLPRKVANKISGPAGRAAAKVVEAKAKQLVPHDPGTLEASIKVRAIKKTKRYKGFAGASVQTGEKGAFLGKTYYGGMIEFGTKHQPQQSFLRHAALLARPQAVTAWAAVVKKALAASAREVRNS